MAILVAGAGAIGCLLGTTLTMAGHKVDYLEPAPFARDLMKTGITVQKDGDSKSIFPNRVFLSIEEIPQEPYDLLIIATKAYDVEDLLYQLNTFLPRITCIMTPQNGIGTEEFVAEKAGSRKILSASITIPVSIVSYGHIKIEKKGALCLASMTAFALDASWAKEFSRGGLSVSTFRDYRSMKWSKMLLNMLGNATSAILGMPPDLVYSRGTLVGIEREAVLEAVNIMKRREIQIIDLPGYPVRSMVRLFSLFPPWMITFFMAEKMRHGRGGKPPSMLQDLNGHRQKSEVVHLNGKIAEEGEHNNIPAPTNRVLSDILDNIAKGRIPWERYRNKPGQLLEKWKQERRKIKVTAGR